MKGTVDKLLGFMRLGDDEYETEYDEMDEVEEDEEYEEEKKGRSFSFFTKKEKDRQEDTEEEDVVSEKPKRTYSRSSANSKVVSINGRGGEVTVIKPEYFSEAQLVADLLREGRTVVVNLEVIKKTEGQRTIDFIGGACYALDGTLQAISKDIFIAAPEDIEVSGDLRDEIINEGVVSPKIN